MSLIQEALRRQQEEAHPASGTPPEPMAPQTRGPEPAAAVKSPIKIANAAPPPPPPQAKQATENRSSPTTGHRGGKKTSRTWATLLGVVFLILLVAAGAIWMLWFTVDRVRSDASVQGLLQTADTVDAGAVGADPAADPSASPEAGGTAQAGAASPAAAPPSGQPPPASGSASAPYSDPTASAGASPAVFPASKPIGPAPDWPDLRLEGMVGKGTSGAAIINGEILSVGEALEGATLVSLERNGVFIQFQGEKRFIKVNRASIP